MRISRVLATLLKNISTLDLVRVVLTFTIVPAALFVILTNKYPPKIEEWAIGILTLLLGFWLRGTGSQTNQH